MVELATVTLTEKAGSLRLGFGAQPDIKCWPGTRQGNNGKGLGWHLLNGGACCSDSRSGPNPS